MNTTPKNSEFVILVNFRSAVGIYGSKDLRGDGSIAKEKILAWENKSGADSMAALLREQFPDTTYRVMTFEQARAELQHTAA